MSLTEICVCRGMLGSLSGYSNLLSPTFLGRTKDSMMSSLGLGSAARPEELAASTAVSEASAESPPKQVCQVATSSTLQQVFAGQSNLCHSWRI